MEVNHNIIGRYLQLIGFLGLVVIIGYVVYHKYGHSVEDYSKSSITETYKEKVLSLEELESSQPKKFLDCDATYKTNFWGSKFKFHGQIANAATTAMFKDVVVNIVFMSKTKTQIGNKEYTIYQNFAPRTLVDFELSIPRYENVESLECNIVSAVPVRDQMTF